MTYKAKTMSYDDKKNMYWVTTDLEFSTGKSAQECLAEFKREVLSAPFAKLSEDGKNITGTAFEREFAKIIAKYVKNDFQITCLFTDANDQVSGGWVDFYNTNGNRTASVNLDHAVALLPKKKKEIVLSINSDHPCFDEYSFSEIKQKYQQGLDNGSLTIKGIEKELDGGDFNIREVDSHINLLNECDPIEYFMLLKA